MDFVVVATAFSLCRLWSVHRRTVRVNDECVCGSGGEIKSLDLPESLGARAGLPREVWAGNRTRLLGLPTRPSAYRGAAQGEGRGPLGFGVRAPRMKVVFPEDDPCPQTTHLPPPRLLPWVESLSGENSAIISLVTPLI